MPHWCGIDFLYFSGHMRSQKSRGKLCHAGVAKLSSTCLVVPSARLAGIWHMAGIGFSCLLGWEGSLLPPLPHRPATLGAQAAVVLVIIVVVACIVGVNKWFPHSPHSLHETSVYP